MYKDFLNKHNLILTVPTGSVAYGTETEGTVDKDYLSISISSPEYYLGLKTFESDVYHDEEIDHTVYDIKKFLRLLSKNNPNILGMLWTEPMKHIVPDLVHERERFLSKALYLPFRGFATSELANIQKTTGNTGEKRRKRVEEIGYDPKKAYQVMRLLAMGAEILRGEGVHVNRSDIDAGYLKAVKRGDYYLDQIHDAAKIAFDRLDYANTASPLPDEVEDNFVNQLCVTIIGKRLCAF